MTCVRHTDRRRSAPLYGDIDGDGFVDLNDLNILAAVAQHSRLLPEQYCADLT